VKHFNCKLYYQQLHLKYLCNLARYWLHALWGWHDSVETCSSVISRDIIVHLLVIIQNNKLCYQQLHLKYFCNLARYWLQAPWGWHDSVETCSSVIICEIIVYLLVTVQNNEIKNKRQCSQNGVSLAVLQNGRFTSQGFCVSNYTNVRRKAQTFCIFYRK
jgi:hypothetical protein